MIIKSYEILKIPSNYLKYKLFLLYGENNGLKNEIRNSIKIAINQKNNDTEVLTVYENEVYGNEENFYNSIYSGSLFSKSKIIIIQNGTDKIIKQIKNVTEKYPENIFLIIFADLLEKKSKLRNFFEENSKILSIPCYSDSFQDLQNITINEFKKSDLSLSKESINLLIEKSNSDRGNLRNEIEKIKSYAVNKKKLEIDEIKNIINFSGEYKSDILVNECLCGNTFQYKRILAEIYTNTINQVFILRILSNKIQRLLKMKEVEKEYKNIDNLLNSSKPPIFWKEKPMVKKQLLIWNLNELKVIVDEINNTEILCKKNPQLSKLIFFNFFTNICKKANNYS